MTPQVAVKTTGKTTLPLRCGRAAHLMPEPDRLRSSVTGEAEAGSAGEQPVLMPSSEALPRPMSRDTLRPPTPMRRPGSSCSASLSTPRCRPSPAGSNYTSGITRATRPASSARSTRPTTRTRMSSGFTACWTSLRLSSATSRATRPFVGGDRADGIDAWRAD